ncbi:ornithine cyclodeaminase [Afipia sp. Root123D2]|uniref:ornithine cyclodeaminase family protein n=1 Tax=Afipia sp. Root123D2 TaxID=1736436 RepID=UPI000700A868|nr:ornithine cyclodeaminase family protein [Afipia sp. Root123D2]KQW20859.1 ornithine cyclodeaminase [Afipia sp. Root123D2]
MTATDAPIMIDAARTRASLPFDRLIPALREAYASGADVPLRHHHFIPQPDGTTATILIMPAWRRELLGIKIVTIFPENGKRNLPGLFSSYLLCDGSTGQHLALIDGNEITSRRTVGIAALGASFLARENASKLLIAGSGRIASLAADAFRSVRPISKVAVWNINRPGAERLVAQLRADSFDAYVAPDLEKAVGDADIVSCATLATEPIIKGTWLKPGTHLDLIGSFTPFMREADDEVFRRARIYVDTMDALKESGELLDPIRDGVIVPGDIQGTLAGLCRGEHKGRGAASEITVFKAVGNALSDIASASLVYQDFTDPSRSAKS